jgi:amino acid transporter
MVSPTLSSTSFVLTKFNNETGFDSSYYVAMIGLLASLYAFAGYEAAGTMAEET